MSTLPLIAIVGTTGVGKSRLAVELALALRDSIQNPHWKRARVINADAMQVYRGLDVLTNKITEEEKKGVEHSLMAFKDPGEEYVVGEWVRDASQIIDVSHQQNVLPIIAGGTSYWVQHLLFPERLSSNPSEFDRVHDRPDAHKNSSLSAALLSAISQLPDELKTIYLSLPDRTSPTPPEMAFPLHNLLTHLDPAMAARWHWKDTRKVIRSLEIIREHGCRVSDIVHKQDERPSRPRYRTLIFWVYADRTCLEPRLDARVDIMLAAGILSEIAELRRVSDSLAVSGDKTDCTRGIFQSIGYKEFSTCATVRSLGGLETPLPSDISAGLERMKLSTRQYAKKQVKWIKNRLLPAINATADDQTYNGNPRASLFLLDATDIGDAWERNVKAKSVGLLKAFLDDDTLPDPSTLSDTAAIVFESEKRIENPSQVLNARQKRVCSICTTNESEPIMLEVGQEWDMHVKSRAHRLRQNREGHLEVIRGKREEYERRQLTKGLRNINT